MEKSISVTKIVKAKDVTGAENVLKDRICQTPFIELSENNGTDNGCVVIKKDGYILLDFGRELNGGIKIAVQTTSEPDTKLHIVFGESVMEALSELGEKNSGNYHSVRDLVFPAVRLSTQRVGDTGFRFVRIQAQDGDVTIYTVKAISEKRDLEYKGTFICNDNRLNDIWKTAVYTVELNMQEILMEGVKRDRLVWIGDMHPEVSAVSAVFGNDRCVPKSLDFVRDTTPVGQWMNKTATYSMWWIIIHYDWYMHWGDLEYLKQQIDCLKETCKMAFSWAEEGFFCSSNEMKGFVDWSSKYTDSEEEGRRAIFCMGFDRASKIFDIVSEPEYALKCREYADKLRSEENDKEVNKRMSALTVLSGRKAEAAKKVLAGNSPKEMSTFMGYYVLKAKAMLSDYSDALDIISEYWGAMSDLGATTYWEDFAIEWVDDVGRIDEITPEGKKDIHGDFGKHCYKGFRHSLCHGWASGPAPFLIEEIGGIEILEPGCKKLKISPNLGNLEWIKITYPTPYGIVKIDASLENGELKTEISAPAEVKIIN